MERKGVGVLLQYSMVVTNSMDWWESFSGDSPSLLIDTQDAMCYKSYVVLFFFSIGDFGGPRGIKYTNNLLQI